MTIEHVLRILKRNKLKQTGKREAIVRVFTDSERELTVREITIQVRRSFPTITQKTVTDNLDTFVYAGILNKTGWHGDVRYRMVADERNSHAS